MESNNTDQEQLKLEVHKLSISLLIKGQEEGQKKSELAMHSTHRLAYFVIGFQVVACAYTLTNTDKLHQIIWIDYFFLITGLTILFGIIWLVFYNYHLSYLAHSHIIQHDYEEWRYKNSKGYNDETKEEYNKITGGAWDNYISIMGKLNSKLRIKSQSFFHYTFVILSIIITIWIIISGFLFLKNYNYPKLATPSEHSSETSPSRYGE